MADEKDNNNNIEVPDEEQRRGKPFPIIGIGASAGGLEAIEAFLKNMPSEEGMAFVIIQHISPTHKSVMDELLRRHTQMRLRVIEDGMEVESNCIYFNPPAKEVGLYNGVFHLTDSVKTDGITMPIDHFFRTLADDQGERAICIILSGTGSDGTLGLEAVKGAGGMTMAQEEQQAKYDSMPRSAIKTGLVDSVLPVEMMPQELIRYVKHPYVAKPSAISEKEATEEKQVTNVINKILLAVRSATGRDFTHYKQNTIRRRIERRMALHRINRMADYHRYLLENPGEAKLLFKDLLIGVTSFFRDPEAFEVLGNKVIPRILGNKPLGSSVRVWVPGCSSGEEALSVAIVFKEVMDRRGKTVNLQIFATDIDSDAIERARLSEYPENIAAIISSERLKRFFTKKENIYRINKEVRESVVFAVQDLTNDPPFSKLDLIVCRNVLIYMKVNLQKKILALFHYTLNPGAYLFLGSSETVSDSADLFSPIDIKWKIFQCKGTIDRHLPAPPTLLNDEISLAVQKTSEKRFMKDADVRGLVERIILDEYAPPCVIINDRHDILYFHGSTENYLVPPIGPPTFNLLKMAREELRPGLLVLLHRVTKQQKTVMSNGIRVKDTRAGQDVYRTIDLIARPLSQAAGLDNLYMVLFKEKVSSPLTSGRKKKEQEGKEGDLEKAALERELQHTKEYLQTTVEELETSNEELKSTNEELESTNEELQSTNEELETAKEELQSTNEELVTVNAELENKIEELIGANTDINNLLVSTDISTIFLDNNLDIKRFTPSVTTLFNLIPSDINRPIMDITSKITYTGLYKDAQTVLSTLQTKETEIITKDGKWFFMRIFPYRTRENVISGLIITFFDITKQKMAEQLSCEGKNYLESIMDIVRQPLLMLDPDKKVVAANKSFWNTFQLSFEETNNKSIYDLENGQWKIPALQELLERVVSEKSVTENFKVEGKFPGVGKRTLLINARQIRQNNESAGLFLLAMEDVTDRKKQ